MRLGSLAPLVTLLCTFSVATRSQSQAQPQSQAPSPAVAPPTAPDPLLSLSPQAAYDQALLPVEIVHRSIDNWSDSETASLAVAIAEAQKFCHARPPSQFSGPDLLGLAQLCALGIQWPSVLQASDRFLTSDPPPPAGAPGSTIPSLRARALAYEVEAALNLHDPEPAIHAGTELLTSEPYTALSQQSTDGLLRYLQLVQTGAAIDLAGKRLDRILPLLTAAGTPARASEPLTTTQPTTAAVPARTSDALSAHELYTAALVTPMLLQLQDSTGAAKGTFATIESSLPAQLSPDDATLIALARRRYELLGATLPTIPVTASLLGSGSPRVNPDFGAATVLLVFPDWCAQCVRMAARDTIPFLARHTADNIHLYALLAQTTPPPPMPATPRHASHTTQPAPTPAAPPTPAELLHGTPTLVVPATLPFNAFAATDFPLLLVTDQDGHIRFAQTAPDNAFVEGSLVDQVLTRITDIWPPPAKP